MTLTPLARTFYEPSARLVAPRLLGHWLVRPTPEGLVGGVIVETEAYLVDDPACHGFRRETPRNRSIYGEPGRAYVYFIYGNHFCFNAVTAPRGVAEAVLVRAIEPTFGSDLMQRRRPVNGRTELTNGPGKLCQALGLGREHDGVDLCDPASPVFIAENPEGPSWRRRWGPLVTTTRIGISVAEDLPLRFFLSGSESVSRKLRVP